MAMARQSGARTAKAPRGCWPRSIRKAETSGCLVVDSEVELAGFEPAASRCERCGQTALTRRNGSCQGVCGAAVGRTSRVLVRLGSETLCGNVWTAG